MYVSGVLTLFPYVDIIDSVLKSEIKMKGRCRWDQDDVEHSVNILFSYLSRNSTITR